MPIQPDLAAPPRGNTFKLDLTTGETTLFEAFVRAADSFTGFGAGATTLYAAAHVKTAVVAIDGAQAKLDDIAAEARTHADWTQPLLIHADIGPVNGAGHPTDQSTKDRWPIYSSRLWSVPGVAESDLFMIGGRFRVACAVETLLRCRKDAVILFQTYKIRSEYHGVANFAREIASVDALTAFVPRPRIDADRAHAYLERFRLVTS